MSEARRVSKVDRVKEEWGFTDEATAAAFLRAQRKKSGLPPKGPSGLQRKSLVVAAARRYSAGTAAESHKEPAPVDRRKGNPEKAQDAVAAYRRMKEEERRQAAAGGEPPPNPACAPGMQRDEDAETVRSFQSEEPNARLLRNSRGSSAGFG